MAKKNSVISNVRNMLIRAAKNAGAYSVKINNGELLAVRGRDGTYYWNRNGMPINKDYRYYDPNVSAYRVLGNSSEHDGKTHTMKYSPKTPIETKNLDELKSRFGKETAKNFAAEKSQAIVIPKNDKSITLRTKDRNNFSTLDESLLDSIAINSGRSKTDFFSNLALVLRESSGGNKAPLLGRNDYESDYKIDSDNSKDGSTRLNPRYLTNNHAYYNNAYGDALAEIGRRYPNSFKSGDISLSENERAAGDKDAILADKAAKDILEKFDKNGGVPGGYHERYSDNIMQDAFIRSSKNPQGYNQGEKGRVGKLNNEVLQLRADRKLQEYYSRRGSKFVERGYNEGQTKSSIQKKKYGGSFKRRKVDFYKDKFNK